MTITADTISCEFLAFCNRKAIERTANKLLACLEGESRAQVHPQFGGVGAIIVGNNGRSVSFRFDLLEGESIDNPGKRITADLEVSYTQQRQYCVDVRLVETTDNSYAMRFGMGDSPWRTSTLYASETVARFGVKRLVETATAVYRALVGAGEDTFGVVDGFARHVGRAGEVARMGSTVGA